MRKHLSWRVPAACRAAALACLVAVSTPAQSWPTAHGNPDNSGFIDVVTGPARAPLATVPRLGGIGAGAGPVVAPNGTVFVGNARGKLMSFAPDGTPGWSIKLGGGGILASPAIGADGSIYVVTTAKVRDHTVTPVVTRTVTELHKVNSAGVEIWHTPLPRVYGGLIGSAPPTLWRSGGTEVIMVPSIFRQDGGQFEAHLTAFSIYGHVLADTKVGSLFGDMTGEWGDVFSFGGPNVTPAVPTVNDLPAKIIQPFPAAAIYAQAPTAQPKIFMSDGHRDLVAFAFNGDSFQELFRTSFSDRYVLSTPTAWIDGHAVVSTGEGGKLPEIFFFGANLSTPIRGPYSVAAPTGLSGGRFAFVHYGGGVTIVRGVSLLTTLSVPGQSIASAAGSRTHLFVSTASALHAFDSTTYQEVSRFGWVRGGMSPPAIGPQGHLYAIADDTLHVFGPPLTVTTNNTTPPSGPYAGGGTTGDVGPVLGSGIFQDSGIPAPATQQSKSYKPPLTAGGNRLFACEKLDGDDCGKGDYRAIAAAFCAKSGYGQANDLKVDSRKVKAETLDGRYCSKKKCKVFDEIVCAM